MPISRRTFTTSAAALLCATRMSRAEQGKVSIILAPSNLGLRPESSAQPGTWRAPGVLLDAGLSSALSATRVIRLDRPSYQTEAQPGTRIRNGLTIRRFSLDLAQQVREVIENRGFPVVIGGDCSIMLGCLYGLRRAGGRGLVHLDGHSDFYHPGNYDVRSRLGSVAGMDLALSSRRGEPLLTEWPDVQGPLASDADTLQIGDRESGNSERVNESQIMQITVQRALRDGLEAAPRRAIARLAERDLQKAWLHVDLDVLDERVMNAVDSPGSPGFNYAQLSQLVSALCASGRIAGADFAIYDPDRDPGLRFASPLVRCIADGVRGLASSILRQ